MNATKTLNTYSPPPTNQYPLVVLGGGAVGKSSLTVMLVLSHFVEAYDPTIEDSYRTQADIDGQVALLDILDTAGQEEYTAMRSQYMRMGRGFIMVYSVTSRASFDEVVTIREQLYHTLDKDFSDLLPVVLCGNKCDLELERQVSTNEGQDLAKSYGWAFFETSAKLRVNVDQAFHEVVRLIRHQDDKLPKKHSKKQCALL